MAASQQLVELDVLARLQRGAVLQQQPMGTLDDLPAPPVGSQLIRPVDTEPVDDLPTILGHDVEQVEDDRRVRAVMPDLELIAGVHAHITAALSLAQRSGPRSRKNGRMSSRPRPRPIHNTRLRVGSTITVA